MNVSTLPENERAFLTSTNMPPPVNVVQWKRHDRPDPNELHIDLLRCEFCGRHNKLFHFCSACGRARTKRIIAQPHEYRNDRQLDAMCRGCYSRRLLTPFCVYCHRAMTLTMKPVAPKTIEAYVDGYIRDVDVETGEPIPIVVPKGFVLMPGLFKRHRKPVREATKPAKKPVPVQEGICTQYGYYNGCIVPGCYNPGIRHHFIPRRHGGSNGYRNLIMICKQHEDPIHLAGRVARMMEAGQITRYTLRSLQALPNFRPEWIEGMSIRSMTATDRFPY